MVSQTMTLAEVFQSKRKELSLSIKEVESATSIRGAYIEAIETGSGAEMISSVYLQGFMRQYAIFLGLDVQQLEAEFKEAFSQEVNQEPPKEFAYGLGSIEMRQGTLSNSIWKSNNIVMGVAFVSVFAVAYLLIKLLGVF
jgi:cytoskeletal protein RodZ